MLHALALMILVLASGAISAAETALFAVDRQTLQRFRASAHRLHRLAASLMDRPQHVLITVLLANTAANIAIYSVSFVVLQKITRHSAVLSTLGGLVVLLAVILFGEVVPKAVAYRVHVQAAPSAAAFLYALERGTLPLVRLLSAVVVTPLARLIIPTPTRRRELDTDDLRDLVDLSAQQGTITTQENEMLQAIVAMGDIRVSEIMVPRVDVETVSLRDDRARIEQKLLASSRRKLPVTAKGLDDVVGLLYLRDLLLNRDRPWRELVRKVHFVPAHLTLLQLVRHFRDQAVQMAIVVDEYGGTEGLVTVEDVLEQIVGDISKRGEPLEAPLFEQLDTDTYRLAGDLSIRAWEDEFALDIGDGRIDTVGGLVLAHLGRLPREGDTMTLRNLTLTVEKMRGRRVGSVLLRREAPAGEPEGSERD